MELILSCFCCGGIEFDGVSIDNTNIEGDEYLLHDDIPSAMVICKKCKLEDYVGNLVMKLVEVEQ